MKEVNKKMDQVRNIYDHKEKYILKFAGKGSMKFIKKIAGLFCKE